MEKTWTIILGLVILLVLGYLYYKSMAGYVRRTYGNKWLMVWGNKLYFWQSLIFVSLISTAIILYLLYWGNLITLQ